MISKQEVQHIAKLARIKISDEEVVKFQKDLSEILDYFQMLKKADTSKVDPTFNSTEKFLETEIMRKDEVMPETTEGKNKILEQAPEKKERYIKVKSVF